MNDTAPLPSGRQGSGDGVLTQADTDRVLSVFVSQLQGFEEVTFLYLSLEIILTKLGCCQGLQTVCVYKSDL